MSYSAPWYDSATIFGEWDELEPIPPTYQKTTLIDCGYGEAAPGSRFHGGHFSDLRLTVAVPGLLKRCYKPSREVRSTRCDTGPDPDGTMGPIRIYISERPSKTTTLLGFGLYQSADETKAKAASAGFWCEQYGVAEILLRCTRGSDAVDIRFNDGRAIKIQQFIPRDRPGQGGGYDQVVLRFGLNRTPLFSDERRPEFWQAPNSRIRVTLWSDADPMVLILEDTPVRPSYARP